MLNEHTQVVLVRPVPGLGLKPGDVGVVVHVHEQGQAYEVEFLSLEGRTIGVQTTRAMCGQLTTPALLSKAGTA